jgi:CSLREA domain-containing protein
MPHVVTSNSAARGIDCLVLLTVSLGLFSLPAPLLKRLHLTASAAATFTVNSTGDGADSNTADGVCDDGSGNCTLRAAIQQANATPGTDTVNFQIGSGPQTIKPAAALPALSDPVVIDGATQPGYASAPIIELDGSSVAYPGAIGLVLTGGDSTVRGLVLHGFTSAIFIETKGGNRVEGCHIGTDMTGAVARGNTDHGILIATSNNVVGGTTPAARNVISGNGGSGVLVTHLCCPASTLPLTGNIIRGNYVGVNAAGDAAIPNQNGGVLISSSNFSVPVADNVVGGSAPGAGNVVSGNVGDGVMLATFGVAHNTVQGNFIGTDATGRFAVPNTGNGVAVTGRDNLIGGSASGAGNLISGNGRDGFGGGVDLGAGVDLGPLSGNVVRGNIIGANASLTAPVPNRSYGVMVGGWNTVVGGTGEGEGNVIAFNGLDGVAVNTSPENPYPHSNQVRGNSIFSNGRLDSPQGSTLGINLSPNFGVTPNDAGDADPGPNDLQNFPVITSVTPGASSVNVKGTLDSITTTTYNLDFYASGACDPSGFGEGVHRVGLAQITTQGGDAPFDLTFNVALPPNQVITATATDPAGNTSEFSRCAAAGAATVGSINFEPATVTVNESDGVASFLLTRRGGSAGSITVNYSVRGVTARSGIDFTPTEGTFTFAEGEVAKSFTVPVFGDELDGQDDRTAVVTLSTDGDLDALGSQSTATLVIADDEPLPLVSIGDVSAAEGDSGTTFFEFPVTLSAVSQRDVALSYQLVDGTAERDTGGASGGRGDFYASSAFGGVTIPAGQTSGKIIVNVRGDTDSELDETFFVVIQSAINGTFTDDRAQGTILSDDPLPTVAISIADVTVTEGNSGTTDAAFTVSLSAASPDPVKTRFVVSTLTALSDDFEPFEFFPPPLTFAPGEVTKTVNVAIKGDTFFELDETFSVRLSNPSGAFNADDTAIGTILNDDPRPTITVVNNPVVFEGDSIRNFASLNFTVALSAPSGLPVQFRIRTIGSSATPEEDFFSINRVVSFFPGTTSVDFWVTVRGDTITESTETVFFDISEVEGASVIVSRREGTILNDDIASKPTTFQFDRHQRVVSEDANSVTVTVTRSGDPSQEMFVNYSTPAEYSTFFDDFRATASNRSDFTPTSGTLRFAPGETAKTFDVLITDDAHVESQEFIIVVLSPAPGSDFFLLGVPAESLIYITDNDQTPPAANPIDGTSFFVRQHYRDFFSRDPDTAGLAFWTNEIESCGADALCREVKRISVSQAFFFSIEFQRTGYRVFRLYRATFPDAPPRPRGMPQIEEFLRDTQEVGRNVIVGQGAWEEQLRQNVSDFARRWMARSEVLAQLPVTLTAEQFVDKLFANSGVTPTAQEHAEALAAYGAGGVEGRAAALLSVTDTSSVFNAQYNPAFVYMQYASYLRRHPTETPDTDFTGFDFWLAKLDSFTLPGEDAHDESVAIRRAQHAEMVKAFISSDEYRKRFGP